jgi:esterase/lipase superfamily enzyme
MARTVYFATNRVVAGSAADFKSYGTDIVSPSDPNQITYGTAFVNDANLTADTVGAITSIQDISRGRFGPQALADLSDSGRNLLVFIHGFDNSFENAITRAAFNEQWFAQSGVAAANTTVIAFSWPSLGKLVSFPVPWEDYFHDQTAAGQSGVHIMSFFANLEPIIKSTRANGLRVFLLTHSMGHWALQAAVESWFVHGNGDTQLFDETILAAADERFDSFAIPFPGRLSGLPRLTGRTSIYFSTEDEVLDAAELLALGAQRLGQQGPRNSQDARLFPQAQFRMVDCSAFTDFDRSFESSHQYYRRSALARADIAKTMA